MIRKRALFIQCRQLSAMGAALLAVTLADVRADAQTSTFTGADSGIPTSLSDSGNWSGTASPASGNAWYFNSAIGAPNNTLLYDFTTPPAWVNGITFGPSAGAFTISA
ncbi:MAG TPA: hypothetical protein VG713_18875, partial [Pirellulales bacterium]|nr:hypothetical protein [Pirellulales bacterium]